MIREILLNFLLSLAIGIGLYIFFTKKYQILDIKVNSLHTTLRQISHNLQLVQMQPNMNGGVNLAMNDNHDNHEAQDDAPQLITVSDEESNDDNDSEYTDESSTENDEDVVTSSDDDNQSSSSETSNTTNEDNKNIMDINTEEYETSPIEVEELPNVMTAFTTKQQVTNQQVTNQQVTIQDEDLAQVNHLKEELANQIKSITLTPQTVELEQEDDDNNSVAYSVGGTPDYSNLTVPQLKKILVDKKINTMSNLNKLKKKQLVELCNSVYLMEFSKTISKE